MYKPAGRIAQLPSLFEKPQKHCSFEVVHIPGPDFGRWLAAGRPSRQRSTGDSRIIAGGAAGRAGVRQTRYCR